VGAEVEVEEVVEMQSQVGLVGEGQGVGVGEGREGVEDLQRLIQ
jgi:hypothetical protein